VDNSRFFAGGFTGRVEIHDWNGDMPLEINTMTVHSSSQEMVEVFGETFQRCMSLCLEHMDTIRYPTLFFQL